MNIEYSQIKFRKAAPHDAPEIKQLAAEVVYKNYAPFLGLESTKNFIESGASDQIIDESMVDMLIAEHAGEIVGIAVIKADLLDLLMVKYALQGKGIGGALLDQAEEVLFENHATIRLETFEDNVPTIAFYQKHGWEIVGKESNPYADGDIFKFDKQKQ